MYLDSDDFIQNKQEELDFSNQKKNESPKKSHKPIKQNQIMNLKRVMPLIAAEEQMDQEEEKISPFPSPARSASLYNHSSPPKVILKKSQPT